METEDKSIEALVKEIAEKTGVSELQANESFKIIMDYLMWVLVYSNEPDSKYFIEKLRSKYNSVNKK